MRNKDIRPEWVPSAYKNEMKDEGGTNAKTLSVKISLNSDKGIYSKIGFKRKYVK